MVDAIPYTGPTGRDQNNSGPVNLFTTNASQYKSQDCILAHPRSAGEKGLRFAGVLFFSYFSDFCRTNYLNIYQTDLHEILQNW